MGISKHSNTTNFPNTEVAEPWHSTTTIMALVTVANVDGHHSTVTVRRMDEELS